MSPYDISQSTLNDTDVAFTSGSGRITGIGKLVTDLGLKKYESGGGGGGVGPRMG
jgi:hypothetical protein